MRRVAALLLCTGLVSPAGLHAQEAAAVMPNGVSRDTDVHATTAPAAASSLEVKRFDFDERPLGNYEDTPMHWRKLTGDGLPAYSGGRLDEAVGRAAAPSFGMIVQGGSVAYEYVADDLAIEPQTDYLVEGWIRPDGLEHAAAMLALYAVDAAGAPLPGSERVSRIVRSDGPETGQRNAIAQQNGLLLQQNEAAATADAWRRVEIAVRIDDRAAAALRLQCWVLQNYAFEAPGPATVDPILRQEVSARVWFDDIAILRMPRLRLHVEQPGGVLREGEGARLVVDVQNPTPGPLSVVVEIHDANGAVVWRGAEVFPAGENGEFRPQPPGLRAGLYTVYARLSCGARVAAECTRRVVALADEPRATAVRPQTGGGSQGSPAGAAYIGLDVPSAYDAADGAGLAALTTALGCGCVRLDVPVSGDAKSVDAAPLKRLREVIRVLAMNGVETIGVLTPADAAAKAEVVDRTPFETSGGDSAFASSAGMRHLLNQPEGAAAVIGPALAHLSAYVNLWQLGREEGELDTTVGWTGAGIRGLLEQARALTAGVRLVVPRSVLDVTPAGSDDRAAEHGASSPAGTSSPWIDCFWLPPAVPTPAIPWQLAFWTATDPGSGEWSDTRWLGLGGAGPEQPAFDSAARTADQARRAILAAAANPERLFIEAPFELSPAAGHPTWQPTEDFFAVRTLCAQLDRRRATAVVDLPHDGVGILFQGAGPDALVLWTWRECSGAANLYVGSGATMIELSGRATKLSGSGCRARVPLEPAPAIVTNISAPLLLLQNACRIEPDLVQIHKTRKPPTLHISNPWPDQELAGSVELEAPPGWRIAPNPIAFTVPPGDALAEVLAIETPPRQIATEQPIAVRLRVERPTPVELDFTVALRVGLDDVRATATAGWQGDDLIVRQTVQNRSTTRFSFSAFCQAVGRRRLEAALLDLRPGESRELVYRLPAARDGAAGQVWLGLREIGGPRTLDQLADIPPFAGTPQ